MLNAEQATEAITALPYPTSDQFNSKEEFRAARAERRTAENDVTKEFRAYLEDTYTWGHSAEARQTIWDAAWSNGHASGYGNVESHYNDYSDLSDEELEELDF